MRPEKSAEESRQDGYTYFSKWVDLIGPEYGAVIRPYRRLFWAGLAGTYIGLAAGIFWSVNFAPPSLTYEFFGAFAFVLPGLIAFVIGFTLQTRLSYRINYDLWAVGVLPPHVGPASAIPRDSCLGLAAMA